MYIKEVNIRGFRNVDNRTYKFDEVTYLHGPNGVGKSTVLNAIQLALLGYIPGVAKSNQAIMQNANCPEIRVRLTLSDDNRDVCIVRTVSRRGNSCSQTVEGDLSEAEILDLIGDLKLPVFDWNEFISTTSNKLKSWFIEFIPNMDVKVDWKAEISDCLGTNLIYNKNAVAEYSTMLGNCEGDTELDKVIAANKLCKESLSYVKAYIAEKENTINGMSEYLDEDISESDISVLTERRDVLSRSVENLRSEISKAKETNSRIESEVSRYNKIKSSIPSKEKMDSVESELSEIESAIERINNQLERKQTEVENQTKVVESLHSEVSEIKHKLEDTGRITNSDGMCPYTSCSCKTISDLKDKYSITETQLNKSLKAQTDKLSKEQESLTELSSDISKLEADLQSQRSEKSSLQSEYRLLCETLEMYSDTEAPDESDRVSDEDIQKLQSELAEVSEEYVRVREEIVKAEKAAEYKNSVESMIQQKYELQEKMDILNKLVKLTSSNGLQTKLSESSFSNLEKLLTPQVEYLFGKGTSCKFNVEAKANSFSFGILREGKYIPYNLLSTGEKTLYTFALMKYIISVSSSSIKLLLMDDFLDHLDPENFKLLMDIISSCEDEVQMITAGVVDCDSDRISVVRV